MFAENMQVFIAFVFSCLVASVSGHGRLLEPPSRASMWRYGFLNPKNYNDNQLYCGGVARQWKMNKGKCGICGDPYDDLTRPHEAGGKFANGIIVRKYQMGQIIDVTVHLTANHLGWFEFRLCPNNNYKVAATQDCLNRHILKLAENSTTRYKISAKMIMVKLKLRLPVGLTCTQCVFQWKYNTGNSWGKDPITGKACKGCGPQEQFYGCADVSIDGTNGQTPRPATTSGPSQSPPPSQTPVSSQSPAPSQTPRHTPRSTLMPSKGTVTTPTKGPCGPCRAVGIWAMVPGMDGWCNISCKRGLCPPSQCICS